MGVPSDVLKKLGHSVIDVSGYMPKRLSLGGLEVSDAGQSFRLGGLHANASTKLGGTDSDQAIFPTLSLPDAVQERRNDATRFETRAQSFASLRAPPSESSSTTPNRRFAPLVDVP
ncbi:hypothetical protein SVAN01_02835 [Stagonosporopsis vannaccii]|nr:hypothetical protein SVAN01_02835 [Stagonosporopsis vannaccii]